MKRRSPLSLLIRGFLIVMLLDLAVIAVISLVSWWAGWMYLEEFQKAVYLAGALLIGGGFAGLLKDLAAARRSQRGEKIREPIPGSDIDGNAHPLAWLGEHGLTVIFLVAGGVCLLIGILLV